MKRYRNKIIVGLILGFGVIAATMLLSDVNQLMAQAVAFPWLIMVPVLAMRVANWILRFIKWHYYLQLIGVRGLRSEDSAAVFVSGFVLSLSPGKVAEALKALAVRGLTGTPVSATLPVIAAERLSDGMAVLLLMGISVVRLAANQYWGLVVAALLFFVGLIVVLQIRPLCLWLLGQMVGLPLFNRAAEGLYTFYDSSYELVRWKPLLIAVGLGSAANLLDGLGVYLILLGLGLPATMVTFYQALLIISLSVIVGSVSTMPGGLGAADLSIGVTMSILLGLGKAEVGLATLLARIVQLWWGVIVGTIVGLIYRSRLFPSDTVEALEPGDTQIEPALKR